MSGRRESSVVGPGDPDGRPAYSASGVDLTLIREELRRTPMERLEALRMEVEALEALERSFALRHRTVQQ